MATSKSLILSGFKEDCEQLIARFVRADDIRFQTFCEIWKDMKFSLIFAGRPSYVELLEFCEEALNVCKQFLLLPPSFKERIGGLYLLYGVYYKMPVDQFKIRAKLDDWRSIVDLHAEIREAEHLDANYILCKLIADSAFHFCIFDKEFGLEKYYRSKESQCFNPYSVLPILKDLIERCKISEISELSKAYEEKKQAAIARDKSNNSLNLFNANIAQEIMSDIQRFEEERRNKQMSSDFNSGKTSNASTSRAKQLKSSSSKSTSKRRLRPLIDDNDFETDSNESEDDIIETDDSDLDSPETLD